ncbi:Uncharacterized protein OBRU01_06937 [Operophtera brumata]|uniref:Uncharacterized protein n=1 Tax=Operophtera brumata TaxID=104452 RepID=A0A0L7LKC8_OPEBR|nr:Uncharacterized protein OBRU01_06937 [Operophtera brumata]
MAEVSVDLEILSDDGGVIVSGVGEGDFESGGGVGNGGSLLEIGGSSGNDHGGVRNGGSLLEIGGPSGNDHGGVGNGGSLLGLGVTATYHDTALRQASGAHSAYGSTWQRQLN